MDNLTDVLDDMTNLEFNEAEQAKLNEKFRPRTQSEINEPFYKASLLTRNIGQFLSVLLAIGLPIMVAERFSNYYVFAFGLFLGLVVLWEIGKRLSIDKQNEIRVINRKKKVPLSAKPYKVASFFLVFGSMSFSFFGAPHVIEQLSSHKPLAIIDSVRMSFNDQIDQIKEEYTSTAFLAFGKADTLHRNNSWKGKTSRSVRDEKAKLELLGAQLEAEKMTSIKELERDKNLAVAQTLKANQDIIIEHKDWCRGFGWFACAAAILLDILVIFLSIFIANHEERKRVENESKRKLQEKQQEEVKDFVKQVVKDKEQDNDFKPKDGDIQTFAGQKKNRIFIPLSDGSLKDYNEGQLKNLIKGSSEKRAAELQPYLEKLQNFEL